MSELQFINDFEALEDAITAQPLTLVEFGAEWCGPCKRFLPHFEKYASKHPEVQCIKVDIDVDPVVVSYYNIKSVPQVWLFEGEPHTYTEIAGRTVIQLEREIPNL